MDDIQVQFLEFERKDNHLAFCGEKSEILMSFSCTITPLISTVRVELEKLSTFAFSVSLMCVTKKE